MPTADTTNKQPDRAAQSHIGYRSLYLGWSENTVLSLLRYRAKQHTIPADLPPK